MRFIFIYIGIFGSHVLAQFLIYGQAQLLPHFLDNEIFVFITPFVAALFGYFFALRRLLITKSFQRWRLALSFVSALVSLCAGLIWSFNTYGT